MQATSFENLRDLVMHHGARRGWRTQRHIAVMCGLDESALSRFLNGEQDIGARRTHDVFRAVGIPIENYDLAYALLGKAQDEARAARRARTPQSAQRLEPAPASIAVPEVERVARTPLADAGRWPRRPLSPARRRAGGMTTLPSPIRLAPSRGRWWPLDNVPDGSRSASPVEGAHAAHLGDLPTGLATLITNDLPAAVLVGLVLAEQLSGEEIASIMGG